MPVASGMVDRISVFPQFCCLTIRTAPTQQRLMLLWSYFAQEDNATNRLLHGAYLAIVRDALVHSREVQVSYASGSALVDSVSLVNV